jgi:hypothetical protein
LDPASEAQRRKATDIMGIRLFDEGKAIIVSRETPDVTGTKASALGVEVTITRSGGKDGAIVVFIDTEFEPDGSDKGPGLRVLVNDDPAYVGKEHEENRTELAT